MTHRVTSNHLGIDHPLVAVKDLDSAAKDFERLGFFINPRHHHPWGTDNHLLMFPENFIEVISVYDHSTLDLPNEAGFACGRFISDAIARREGIALVALHSEDARSDHQLMIARGVENQGLVDFRRVAHRPDGTEAEATVSLVMLINDKALALSHFFCHQHQPEWLWVEEWMDHPNGANGIMGITYISERPKAVASRFIGIYGPEAIEWQAGCLKVHTDRGYFEVLTLEVAQDRFAGVELPITAPDLPTGVAIRISTTSVEQARQVLQSNQVPFVETTDNGIRIPASYAGNTIIELYPENDR